MVRKCAISIGPYVYSEIQLMLFHSVYCTTENYHSDLQPAAEFFFDPDAFTNSCEWQQDCNTMAQNYGRKTH